MFSRIRRWFKSDENIDRLGATSDSWKDPRMPREQREIVESELKMLYEGNPPPVFARAVEALSSIPGKEIQTLLEAGCASGYYSEVISQLLGNRFKYTGGDYSDAMLELARQKYPGVPFLKLDVCNIDLHDQSYDVVLSGAVIMHVEHWEKAIQELARVARKFLVLHRTPVTTGPVSRRESLSYASVPIFFNQFNKKALVRLVESCGFQKIFEKEVYQDKKDRPVETLTYVFQRVSKL
jgi:ubiquinone/menaquinone biosynthesis C-methylase UbiE